MSKAKMSETFLDLLPTELKLLVVLCDQADENGVVDCDVKALSSASGLSKTTVLKACRNLSACRYLTLENDGSYTVVAKNISSSLLPLLLSIKGILSKERDTKFLEPLEKRPKYLQPRQNILPGVKSFLPPEDLKRPPMDKGQEVRILVQAARLLGRRVNTDGDEGLKLRRLMARRWNEGATEDDLLNAVRYAVKEYNNGNRFRPLRHLQYVWSPGNFETILSCKGEAGRKPSRGEIFGDKKEYLDHLKKKRPELFEGEK